MVVIVVLGALNLCAAENLVPGGDFTEAKKGKIDWCRREGGAFSLFNEEYTWNNCGKLEIRETYTNGNVHTRSASVSIGRDGRFNGFAVKPDTTYDFSLDLRGGVKGASVRVVAWHGDNYWKDRQWVKVSPTSRAQLETTWSTFKGSFRTPGNARRAALHVAIWSSDEGGGKLYEPGDFVLIDNVRVEESTRNFAAPAPSAASVPVRKAIATGDGAFDDFVNLRNVSVPAAKTTVTVKAVDGAFLFDIVCDEPRGVSSKDDGSVWSGDSLEVWFGAAGDGRRQTQFGIGANGAKYASVDGEKTGTDCFDASVKRMERSWRARVKVPFASVGWKASAKRGDRIAFNIGRYRRVAHVYETWSPLKTGFNDTEHFGELVLDDYAAALEARFGKGAAAALKAPTRAAYEKAVAAAEAAEREAKFAKFKGKRFSVAPVPVTSDSRCRSYLRRYSIRRTRYASRRRSTSARPCLSR